EAVPLLYRVERRGLRVGGPALRPLRALVLGGGRGPARARVHVKVVNRLEEAAQEKLRDEYEREDAHRLLGGVNERGEEKPHRDAREQRQVEYEREPREVSPGEPPRADE